MDTPSCDMWQDVCAALLEILEKRSDSVEAAYRFLQTLPENDVRDKLFPFYTHSSTELQRAMLGNGSLKEIPGRSEHEELCSRFGFLHASCRKGDINAALMLMYWGIEPCCKNAEGMSALEVATTEGHLNIITKLVEMDEGLTEDVAELKLLVCRACRVGKKEIIDYWLDQLIRQSPNPGHLFSDQHDPNPLVFACQGEHYNIAADLIERGIVSIDEAASNMLGADILPLLKIWVEPDEDSSTNNNNNKKELIANWHHKQLNTFDPSWLQDFQDSAHHVLSTINLSQNSLLSVPEGLLWGLQNLRRLNLSQNSIQLLPSPKSHRNLSECRLRSLSLYQNELVSVPAELFMLEDLEFLSLANNSMTEIIQPAKESTENEIPRLWRCMSLANLDLSQNKLSSLPREMDACTSLITINLSENSFNEVPRPWACPLEILNISKNMVQSAPRDLPKFWHRTLRFLNLSYNRLTEVPASVCLLSSLSELDLSHNVLRCFPLPGAWSIRKLQHLNLAYNQLMHRETQPQSKQVNPKTSPVKKKKDIFHALPMKKKKDTPPTSPTSPRHQQAVANFYTKLRAPKSPGKIIDANSRSTFYTHYPSGGSSQPEQWEKIEFPECFAHSLYVLKLSHNALEDVPPSVCKLEALYDLDVSWNPDLHKLPEALSTLKHLFHLKIEDLDIKIPAEISQLSPEERCKSGQVLKILHEKLLDSQPYHSMKLMIMGPAKSGKTTLLGSLMNDTSGRVLDMALHVTEWELQDPVIEGRGCSLRDRVKGKFSKEKEIVEGPAITFFSWDMKGGDLYENVHQCFVTAKTLYLLVWDMSEGMNGAHKLSSLLLNISSRSSDFGIVIVGTHHDVIQNSPTDMIDLRSQLVEMLNVGPGFPPVAGIVEVDGRGSKNSGMAELRRVIYETAMQMKVRHKRPACVEKLIGRKVPHPYFSLKKRISQEVEVRQKADPPLLPIMTETELAQIVQLIPDSGVHTPEELQEAINFLHEIGSIVHFTDHLNGLNDLYFIDPVWLACTLQRVNTLPVTSLKGGKVHVGTLRELSKKSRIGEDKFEQYLQLLARFEIVVPISHHWFLVPSRLPRDDPGLMLSPHSTCDTPFYYLKRVYKMPYLPPGFWIRLVSRLIADLQMHDKKMKISPPRNERKLCRSKSVKNSSISKGIKFLQSESIYWREGIFFRHKTGQILVRSTDKSPGVNILISCQEGHFSAMGCVVDQIEALIKDWYPGLCASVYDSIQPKVQRLVPCPVCVFHGPDDHEPMTENLPHCYTVEELVQRCVRGETNIEACTNSKDKVIPIAVLIPDMFMKDLSIRHLKQEDFKLHMVSGQSLGQGGFGEVFKAKFRGKTVAAKTMFPSRLLKNQTFSSPSEGYASCASTSSSMSTMTGDSTSMENDSCDSLEAAMLMESFHKLRNEVAIMSKLDHPCIVNLVGVSVRHLCFAMDYAPLGDLQSYLFSEHQSAKPHFVKRRIVLEPVLCRMLTYKIALQVASAVEFLHSKDIIYCDLKTDNILLFSSDVSDDINIKLTDYGISRTYDLMGAMGMAGPPGFCAPEILQGKVFDEKVDWFSYGMFLYHLMTGMVPYHDQQSRIEIQLAVNEGHKPSFNFPEYLMPPRQVFPALGGLTESCWQDRPGERPHGKTILHLLSEPSFLCLRRVVEVEEDGVSMAFSAGSQDEDKVVHLVVDSGQGTSVRSFKVDEDGSYKTSRQNELQCPMIKTAIATPCGTKLVVGTVGDFVQLYHLPSSQSSNTSLLVEARVAGQPTSLLYLHQPSGQEHSLLFVGQANGTVTILNHETEDGGHHSTDNLRCVARMQLSKHNLPCSSMVAVARKKNGDSVAQRRRQYEEVLSNGFNGGRNRSAQSNGAKELRRNDPAARETTEARTSLETRERTGSSGDEADGTEVWVGCGSNLRIISLNHITLEPDEIQVAAGMEGMVKDVVHSQGSVWCYTSSGLYVYHYSVETRKCLAVLDCRESILVLGSFLPLAQEERQELIKSWEEKEKEQELANATAVCETNSNGDGRHVSSQDAVLQEELPIVDDHFRAACVAAPRRQTNARRLGRTGMNRWNIHSILASQSQSSIKVSSLLVMDHVLWIGRSSGDIVLVNIRDNVRSHDSKCDVQVGEVVTVLNADAVMKGDNGKVVELNRAGSNRVVACHDSKKPDHNVSQIKNMCVWEDWGQDQVEQFQTINNQCRKRTRKSGTYLEV